MGILCQGRILVFHDHILCHRLQFQNSSVWYIYVDIYIVIWMEPKVVVFLAEQLLQVVSNLVYLMNKK